MRVIENNPEVPENIIDESDRIRALSKLCKEKVMYEFRMASFRVFYENEFAEQNLVHLNNSSGQPR